MVALRPLQSSVIREHDLESTEPLTSAPRFPSWRGVGWSLFLVGRSFQPGFDEIRGRIGFEGQSGVAPSRSLVMRSGLPRSV
jgi:hypothetical protein